MKCVCGRRAIKSIGYCNQCYERRKQSRLELARTIVAENKCPKCSLPLKRNLALTGWYQCVAFGADSHRHKDYIDHPKCEFQIFAN